jgi:hypothetical protein
MGIFPEESATMNKKPPKYAKNGKYAAAYLDHAITTASQNDFQVCRTAMMNFLLKFYGDNTSVENFKPSCLKLVREQMTVYGG